jgi:hypothetical protein
MQNTSSNNVKVMRNCRDLEMDSPRTCWFEITHFEHETRAGSRKNAFRKL